MLSGYNIYQRMTVESHLVQAQKLKQKRFQQINDFFTFEREQVDLIIRLIWHYKKNYPLGVSAEDAVRLLTEQTKFYMFGDRVYIIHLLNTLVFLGILEIHAMDKSYDLTNFGIEYWFDSQKK